MTKKTLADLERCNKEAFACVANLECHVGSLPEGPMRGIKDQLTEMRLILESAAAEVDQFLGEEDTRTDLTSRECSRLLSSLVGGLTMLTTGEEVRKAVKWLASEDKFWELLYYQPMCVDQRKLRGEI